MITNTSFSKVSKSIKKAIDTGTIRAVNKALGTTKTKTLKDLRDATGLTNKSLDKRVLSLKATKAKPTASINIAVKVGVQLSEFKPKEKKIILGSKKNKRGPYYGVTVKIGNAPRELVPGGFLRSVRGGRKELVLARKGSLVNGQYVNSKAPRTPTVALRSNVLKDAAAKIQVTNSKYMQAELDRVMEREVTFALTQLIDK